MINNTTNSQQNLNNTASNFESVNQNEQQTGFNANLGSDTVKPKKRFNLKMVLGVVVLLLIVLGSGAGFFLSQQTQDLRQQASTICGCSIVGTGDDRGCWCEQGGWQGHVAEPGSCSDIGVSAPSCASTANKCDGWADPNSCHQREEDECFYECNSTGTNWSGPLGAGCSGTCNANPQPTINPGACGNHDNATDCLSEDDDTECSWYSCANGCFPINTSYQDIGCANCAYPTCDANCSGTNCSVSCQNDSNCTTGKNTLVCRGQSGSGCNEAHGSYLPELSNGSGSVGTITEDMWCTTIQIDAWARLSSTDPIEESAAGVVFIGNNGEVCVEGTGCNPNDLDWDCSLVEEVSCDNLTGTLTSGIITNPTETLNYSVDYSGDQISKVDLGIHGNFEGPGWSSGWVIFPKDATLDGNHTGTTTFDDMVSALVATGHDEQELLEKGIIYYANVYGPNGFCTGSETWSVDGSSCNLNPVCNGKVELEPEDPILMCLDVAILDGTTDNEINPNDTPSPFSKNQVIKFRCASDDPSSSQINHYEFRITEPDGNVIEGGTINPAGNSAVSQQYTIPESGTFTAECKLCLTTGCLDYYSIGNTQDPRLKDPKEEIVDRPPEEGINPPSEL